MNRRIEKLGGRAVRQRGSHLVFRIAADDGQVTVSVPQHGARDLAVGTLRAIEATAEHLLGKGWLTR